MKTLKTIFFLFVALNVNAQSDSNHLSKNYFSIEVDPAPFILKGYSFSLKFSPANAPHIAFMGSVYSSEFPDKMMSKLNYENGFRDLKIKTSYAFFADYFLKPDRSGLYFGPSVFFYSKSIGIINSDIVTNFSSIYPNLRVGYVYKPFKKSGFYLNPWFNFGKEIISGDIKYHDGHEFKSDKFSYIVAIHFGYQFTF